MWIGLTISYLLGIWHFAMGWPAPSKGPESEELPSRHIPHMLRNLACPAPFQCLWNPPFPLDFTPCAFFPFILPCLYPCAEINLSPEYNYVLSPMCPSDPNLGVVWETPTQVFLTLLPGQTNQMDLWAQILFLPKEMHFTMGKTSLWIACLSIHLSSN